MKFWKAIYKISGNVQQHSLVVIASDHEQALAKVQKELEKSYPDGFDLRSDLQCFNEEELNRVIGYGKGIADILLSEDREVFVEMKRKKEEKKRQKPGFMQKRRKRYQQL